MDYKSTKDLLEHIQNIHKKKNLEVNPDEFLELSIPVLKDVIQKAYELGKNNCYNNEIIKHQIIKKIHNENSNLIKYNDKIIIIFPNQDRKFDASIFSLKQQKLDNELIEYHLDLLKKSNHSFKNYDDALNWCIEQS